MGTRAVVRINGEYFAATHWDGHPESLGDDLRKAPKDLDSIIRVCAEHSIDMINSKFAPEKPLATIEDGETKTTYFYKSNGEGRKLSYKHILKKPYEPPNGQYSGFGTANLEGTVKLTFSGKESDYNDWANYIYDIRKGVVFVAEGQSNYVNTKQVEKEGKLRWKKMPENGKNPFRKGDG